MAEKDLVELEGQNEDFVEEEHPAGEYGGQDDNLENYLRKIRNYPMLTQEEEYECVVRWQQSRDSKALNKLVNSHLRLAARIAANHKGYGLSFDDMLSEGSIGILKAVDRFDVSKGFRFSTYATWWIQAAIKEFVMRNWSMVKLGTSAAQKKLFFKLRKMKRELRDVDDNEIPDDYIEQIAAELEVDIEDVHDMNMRMSGQDFSLNVSVINEDEGSEWQDILEDESNDQETGLIISDEKKKQSEVLKYALGSLNEREYLVFCRRQLTDNPPSLHILSVELGISRERVRQIEEKSLWKVKRAVKSKSVENRIQMF